MNERFKMAQIHKVILYETGVEYQLALCNYNEKRNSHTRGSQENHTVIKKINGERASHELSFDNVLPEREL